MRPSWGALLLSCLLTGITIPARSASSFSFTTIDVPGAGLAVTPAVTPIDVPSATWTYAYGINDAKQIVGDYGDAAKDSHSFMLANGRYTTIDVPGATETDTSVWGINASGQIVGAFVDANRKKHGYVRSAGAAFTAIDVPGADATEVHGIHAVGQVVGIFQDAGGREHGYVASMSQ